MFTGEIALSYNVRQTFQKSERLCSRKIITGLFDEGDVFYSDLFKVVWKISTAPLPFPAQVAFSVTKRGFRLAVIRNLLKRRLREAYRKNKFLLYDYLSQENIKLVFIIIYRQRTVVDYQTIETSMRTLFNSFPGIINSRRKKS